MCYGEYYPAPGPSVFDRDGVYNLSQHDEYRRSVPAAAAFFAEFLGTLLLALDIFAVTDARNPSAPPAYLAPVFIGLTVAILISVIAPLTQACFNPAPDFGPRRFAYFA